MECFPFTPPHCSATVQQPICMIALVPHQNLSIAIGEGKAINRAALVSAIN